MNESLVRTFCESPHRKLIVAIVTICFGLVVMIPLVDDYFDKKESRTALADDLVRAHEVVEGLPEIEQQLAKISGRLNEIESRSITNATIGSYRNSIVEMVRESDCQIRRFDVSTPVTRSWVVGDNPLLPTPPTESKSKKTPFALERRSVVLLVDGTMESLTGLLAKLNEDDALAYLQRLQLQPQTSGNSEVTLELEMWLFALGREKA